MKNGPSRFALLPALLLLTPTTLSADSNVTKWLVETPKSVEWSALEGASNAKLRMVTFEAVPALSSLTGVYGVTPKPLRSGGSTGTSGREQDGMTITVAVSQSLRTSPVSVMPWGNGKMRLTGGDEIERLTREDLTPDKLRGEMVAGTGSTQLGVSIYRSKPGHGYSGDEGFRKVFPHKEIEFYDLTGPYDCAKLPFKILLTSEEHKAAGGHIQPAMIWFPRSFPLHEQSEDLTYEQLPAGCLVVAAGMNLSAQDIGVESFLRSDSVSLKSRVIDMKREDGDAEEEAP